MTYDKLTTALVEARLAARLTQQRLGERIGLSRVRIGHLEIGYREVSVRTLLAWLDACDCDLIVVPRTRQEDAACSAAE